jgi:hypothetical protein
MYEREANLIEHFYHPFGAFGRDRPRGRIVDSSNLTPGGGTT